LINLHISCGKQKLKHDVRKLKLNMFIKRSLQKIWTKPLIWISFTISLWTFCSVKVVFTKLSIEGTKLKLSDLIKNIFISVSKMNEKSYVMGLKQHEGD